MKYYVLNIYGLSGTSTHKSARSALKERDKREGQGWIVRDETGQGWDRYGGDAVRVGYVRARGDL